MTSSALTCDFVGCGEPAAGHYLSLELGRAAGFSVCTAHFARIEDGRRPKIVAERIDLAELDSCPALFLE